MRKDRPKSTCGSDVLNWVVRDGLSEEVTFEIRHKGKEGTSHVQA